MTILDISYAQGAISEESFRAMTGISRVILRAGRDDSALAQDSVYAGNVARARAAGKAIGHYFFNGQRNSVKESADFFASHIDLQKGDIVAIDVENEPGVTSRYTAAQTLAFAQEVKARLGVVPWVYMSQSVTKEDNWQPVVDFGCPLWVASYSNALGSIAPWKSYVAWQYTSNGAVPGYAGRVDLSHEGTGAGGGASSGHSAPDAPAPSANAGVDWKHVQARLNVYGYGLAVDGIAGPKTMAALHAFQSEQKIASDGIVGPVTLSHLNAARVVASTSRPVLRMGSTGDAVKVIQHKLGGLKVDGIFGQNTENAVKVYQKRNRLAADGVVGPQTYRAMGL